MFLHGSPGSRNEDTIHKDVNSILMKIKTVKLQFYRLFVICTKPENKPKIR